ncbi:hypothetical protein AALK14_02160 [Butyricimonas hominis]|uniref:hypothetical protein n=1 Tax=Butyricimonas TaxID=574697 RepID=UPI0026DB7CC7|nr:hypothetical protein [uncultured Butyricimonas sp.]
MIKLLTFITIFFGSPVQDSICNDSCQIPICLWEYVKETRDNVKSPDVNDIFLLIAPKTKEKGIYRVAWFDTIQMNTPMISYYIEVNDYHFVFNHSNFKEERMCSNSQKEKIIPIPTQVICTLPKIFLSKVSVIDLNEWHAKMKNKTEIELFREKFWKEKCVWIIDCTLMKEGAITLIETTFADVVI